jgi:phosphopantothenoylcysteine decarboxylase / phosphopantothenate---cysteine ligase
VPGLSPTKRYVRDASVAVLSGRNSVHLCWPDGAVVAVEPVDAQWLSAALGRALLPTSGRDLLHLATREQAHALGALLEAGALIEAGSGRPGRAPSPASRRRPCKKLVLAVSGAAQAMHTPALAVALLREVCERLEVVLTAASTHFVSPEALRFLGAGVWTDAYAPTASANVPHVHLAQSAELVLVAPASASTLSRLATGACSDLLSLVVAATEAPVVVAPSMNAVMWRKPAVARNVAQLREDGVRVVEPGRGQEISAGADAAQELGGMGLYPENLLAALGTVLALARAG